MFPSNISLGALPPSAVVRNDILKPTTLGFMKDISDEQVSRETELSTIIDDNLKLLKTVCLPNHLKFDAVSKLLPKIIKKETSEDPLHEVAVKLSKYAHNFFEKMELYFAEIFDYDNKVSENLKSYLFADSKEYVASDLPPSYIRGLTLSYLTECKYHEVFDYRIHRERIKLISVRNNRLKFKKVCDEHNRWVDSLHLLVEPMVNSRVRLIWYVDLNNCKTIEEAFKFKELRKSNLDNEHFFGLLVDMQRNTESLRKSLIEMSRKIFLASANREDPTVDLLCSVMDIMDK
jgi:hypothetical protein